MQSLIEKANTLIEALPYIRRFRGSTIVVKLGGSAIEEKLGIDGIMKDIAFMSIVGLRPVLVHGGGKAISRRLKEKGVAATFVRGLRVTDAPTMEVVEEVLNREVNPELVRLLEASGCTARGLYGEDLVRVVRHTEKDPATGEMLDWGFVGKPVEVDDDPLIAYMQAHIVPVVTPLVRDEAGVIHNVNADDVASAIAETLKARKLVFMSDVPGLLRDPKDKTSLISTLRVDEIDGLAAQGVISGGMLPKVQGAAKAIHAGVRKVHFVDANLPHSLLLELFTDQGVGTEIIRK